MARLSNRRALIVEAARELFASQGYDGTSIQDVLTKLAIAKGTLYHYFRSKEELLEAVVESIVDESLAKMRELLDKSQGTALERLEALVRAGSAADSNQETLRALHAPGNEGMHTRLLAVAISRQAPLYAELIQQGCEEGLLRTDHPLESAEFLLSGFQFLSDVGIYPWAEAELKRRSAAFPHIIERILGAKEGSLGFLSQL